MAARIEQGVLLNVIHDHVMRDITYEDNIDRTSDADKYPDLNADSWSAGGMTVWDYDKLNGDTHSYAYGALGTVNVADGYTTYYTGTNARGRLALYVDHHNTKTGNVSTSNAHNSGNIDVLSYEIMLAGNGTKTRSDIDPETFVLTNTGQSYIHYTYRFNDEIKDGYTTVGINVTGRFRIDPDPATELKGTRLGDVEEGELMIET